MSNPPSPARPRPRPSASGARRETREDAPVTESTAATHRADAASRLPVSEFLFNRAGAPSPFGEDLQFPLPAGALELPARALERGGQPRAARNFVEPGAPDRRTNRLPNPTRMMRPPTA